MMSTPERARETDVRANNSKLASFTILSSAAAGGTAAPNRLNVTAVTSGNQCVI